MQLSIYSETKSFYDIARERIAFYGEEGASITDLFALILGKSVNTDACSLLASLSVREILNLSMAELKELGLNKTMAERVFAVVLLAKKLNSQSMPESYCIRSPEDAYQAVKYLENIEQEKFVVLALNTRNDIIARNEIFCGSLDASIVHPREVYRFALKHAAASIVVAHQHRRRD
ncbi:JAB domain-containing protein, partial [Mycobacterium tuberculosis]|uniref:JAB domain-containing protein n=1 Tax=Mycobacterium tuberculosis TaxID=1773 RepID=UPI0009A13240